MLKNKIFLSTVIAVVVSVVLQLIGAFGFSAAKEVGANLLALKNPLVIIGMAIIAVVTIYTLVIKLISIGKKEESSVLSLSLEVALTGMLFTVVFEVLFATYPLLVG